MSQKRLLKSVLFVLNQSLFSREFEVVKTLLRFEKPVKCRRTTAQFFNCRKTLVEKSRLDPDFSWLKLLRKTLKKFEKLAKCRRTPAQFFICEKTLSIRIPTFVPGSGSLFWDCQNTEKMLKTHSVQENLCPIFWDWKNTCQNHLPKQVQNKVALIWIPHFIGTTDREPFSVGT